MLFPFYPDVNAILSDILSDWKRSKLKQNSLISGHIDHISVIEFLTVDLIPLFDSLLDEHSLSRALLLSREKNSYMELWSHLEFDTSVPLQTQIAIAAMRCCETALVAKKLRDAREI